MPLYRFEINLVGGGDRAVIRSLPGPPQVDAIVDLAAGLTVTVTGCAPVPPEQQEAAGHEGTVLCRQHEPL
jgi:hypothetical protein